MNRERAGDRRDRAVVVDATGAHSTGIFDDNIPRPEVDRRVAELQDAPTNHVYAAVLVRTGADRAGPADHQQISTGVAGTHRDVWRDPAAGLAVRAHRRSRAATLSVPGICGYGSYKRCRNKKRGCKYRKEGSNPFVCDDTGLVLETHLHSPEKCCATNSRIALYRRNYLWPIC